jgi:hypothetical protein
VDDQAEHNVYAAQPDAPMSSEELLNSSPYEGDIDAELAAVPKKTRLPGPTLLLTAGVVALVGFLGGIQADKAWGGKSSSSGASSGARAGFGARSGTSGFGGTGSAGAAGGATVGTVEKIVGNTIYLKTTSGSTIKVTTGGTTKVTVSKTGKAKDLKSGTTVVVQGSTGSDGTITATTVTQGGGNTSGSGAPSGGGAGGTG